MFVCKLSKQAGHMPRCSARGVLSASVNMKPPKSNDRPPFSGDVGSTRGIIAATNYADRVTGRGKPLNPRGLCKSQVAGDWATMTSAELSDCSRSGCRGQSDMRRHPWRRLRLVRFCGPRLQSRDRAISVSDGTGHSQMVSYSHIGSPGGLDPAPIGVPVLVG